MLLEKQIKLQTGLEESDRNSVVKILNTLLADEYLLYTKTRNYHWNVTGLQFNDLHKFFEAQYEELDDIIDDVAERTRALGGNSVASLTEFLRNSRLKEHPEKYPEAREMISNLLADHESVIRNLRVELQECIDKYHDAGTNNFLTDLMEKHEKMAWMLRAFLDGRSA